jgi:hypothetical protein
MSRNRQALNILWLTILLATGFALLVRITSWRAELAETSYQHNLIRLQNFLFDAPPRAVLVGSSLSGRLLSSYFDGTAIAPVANLGLDGSGPAFGLDVVLKRSPRVVIIEENLLLSPPTSNEDVMVDAMQSLRFQSAKYLSMLRANSRPSSMLYTWAKSRRPPAADISPALTPKPATTNTPAVLPLAPSNSAGPPSAKEKLRAQIKALQDRGCRIILVRLPTAQRFTSRDNNNFALGDGLKREFNLAQIDLDQECARRGYVMKYTDGFHLAPLAARQAAQVMAELVAGSQAGNPELAP